MTVIMTRKTSWFSDVFIFKENTFVAVDLSCPPRVSVQDYCDKQHWGRGDGQEVKKKHSQGAKKVSFTARHWGRLQLAFASPKVVLTAQERFLDDQD